MPGIEFADVARALSCDEFARREMKLERRRAVCPFHAGARNYNLAFYSDGKCHCHKCGRTADVVQLAAAVWHTNQLDAARMLNDEYNLGLSDSVPDDEQRQRRQRERDLRELEQELSRAAWGAAADDLREAESNSSGFTLADADNPSTWAAIAKLGKAQDKWNAMLSGVTGW